jgi:hypothetical protein
MATIPDIITTIGPFLDIVSHQTASYVNRTWREALLHADSWPNKISSNWLPCLQRETINPEGLKFLRRLRPRLVYLRFYYGSPVILTYINWCRIRQIDLKFQLHDADLLWLTERTPKLKRLKLDSRKLTGVIFKHWSKLAVTELSLSGCRSFQPAYLKCLPQTTLRCLVLSYIPAITGEHLALLPRTLTSLTVNHTHVETLTHLQHMTHLEQLHLSGCPISDDQLAYLSELPIKRLNLVQTGITDAGLYYLRALPLVAINLSRTKITGSELQYLERKTLKCVSLSRCPHLTTDGLMHLQGLHLNRLSLHQTPITSLEFLQKMSVDTLNLSGCIQLPTEAFALEPPPQVKILMARGLPQLGPEFETIVAKWPAQLQRNLLI